VASRYVANEPDDSNFAEGDNRQLLGLGSGAAHAVQIALDFFNWDLESHGEPWRLTVEVPFVHASRPRPV
jgi:hypothetical protein